MSDWTRKRLQQDEPKDGRIASLMQVYHEYSAKDLGAAWTFYLDAYKKGSSFPVQASDEMMLFQSFIGVVALAARTLMPIATAVAVASWHFSPRHTYDRPNI